jgi:uncharacterized membrane protein YdbT with pleckstrin-like domain
MFESGEFLREGERVVWSGKPVKAPFLIGGFVVSAFGLVWLGFSVFAMWLTFSQGIEVYVTLFLSVFVLIGFGLTVGPPLWQVMRYKNTRYVISDQRLITQTGAIGVDTRFLDLDKIQEVNVNVGFFDRMFGTGSLVVVTAGFPFMGGMFPAITALKEPYKVQKLLQDAAKVGVLHSS